MSVTWRAGSPSIVRQKEHSLVSTSEGRGFPLRRTCFMNFAEEKSCKSGRPSIWPPSKLNFNAQRCYQSSGDKRDERRHALRGAVVGRAELSAHDGLLDLELAPVGGADKDDAEDSAPLADGEAGSGEAEQNSSVDWVADPSVGALDDELMAAFERDIRAPIARDLEPRPDGEGDARDG